ncbi:cytochrome P450 [Boletus coccyginus]|nr:cytochrome P450 [Boletus coccyginus]
MFIWSQIFACTLRTVDLETAVLVVLLSICLICLHELYARYRVRHLPPGVSGLRGLLEIPNEKVWLKILKLNQQYGDIASGSSFGYNIILVGSAKIAEDLLEKRSANYSDRPRSVMCGELSGWGKIMLLSNYNEWFRAHRKWIAQDIGSYASVEKLHSMIEFETRRYLQCVLEDPERNQAHVRKNFTSIILRLSHGYMTQTGDDPLVDLAHVANSQLSMATAPGIYYVDIFPPMKYIPSWLPGAGFRRKAKTYAVVLRDLLEIPHNYVKSQLAAGTALPSLSSRIMNRPDLTEELEDSVKWATATMYQGGADTANSVAYAFYLAMTLNPRVMKKAQQELDSVVGTSRLPTFADRTSLPYMEALFTELLRWHTPAPLTMRCTRVDDEYDGYLIPAGSYVFVNIWAILRDERTYSDPLEFKPERFLGDDPEPHPGNACFGFGRRKCPGYFLGHSSVWLMCAQALAVFDISKRVENGVEITPEFNIVGESIVHQAPFKCSIRPRSEEARRLIRQEFEFPLLEHTESGRTE